jgi:ribosomal 50S subunit-recycling heat shock protein
MVTVNGIKAKPAREVSEGDVISVQTPSRILEVRVLRIPGRNVSKAETQSLYELLKDEALKWEP